MRERRAGLFRAAFFILKFVIDSNRCGGALGRGHDHELHFLVGVAGQIKPRDSGALAARSFDPAVLLKSATQTLRKVGALCLRRVEEKRLAGNRRRVREIDELQLAIFTSKAEDAFVANCDRVLSRELEVRRVRRLRIGASRHLIGPCSQGEGQPDRIVAFSVCDDVLVTVFEAVAVGAMMHTLPVKLVEALKRGEQIPHSSGEKKLSRLENFARFEFDGEGTVRLNDSIFDMLLNTSNVISIKIAASEREKFRRSNAIAREKTVHLRRKAVSALAGIYENDLPAAAGKDQRGGKPRRSAPDDDHVKHPRS